MRIFAFLKKCLLLLGFITPHTFAQIGSWQAHTAMRQINDLADAGTEIWAATQGGVFGYSVSTGEIRRITTIEGLHALNPNAIAYDDRRKALWIGYEDGALDRYDLSSKNVHTFRDIARATQFTDRSIGRIKIHGDSILVATAFGIVIFDAQKNEIRDSYTQFGSLSSGLRVYDMMIHPLPDGKNGFWVALERGVAYAPMSSANLREPFQWTLDQRLQNVNSIGKLGSTVFIGTKMDGYALGANDWERQGFISGEVRKITYS
ncbi:MAG TPA: hypothetical protein DIW24_00400, partial [Bacteroidetes bacterium]|nr:hypothetical protein [Bacteroidota bacterium]